MQREEIWKKVLVRFSNFDQRRWLSTLNNISLHKYKL